MDEEDQAEWLRRALRERGGVSEQDLELPLYELMEMWTDVPDPATVERINNNYRGVSELNTC